MAIQFAEKLPQLVTNRLVLRGLEQTDAAVVKTLSGAFEIADTTSNIPHPYEAGMAEAWIATHKRAFIRDESLCLGITLADNKTLIGAISLMNIEAGHQAELGYWIGVPYWNQGFCQEAANAMIDHGFNKLGFNRLHARCLLRNPASSKVLEKCGFQTEGLLRQHLIKWGKPEDVLVYGLLKNQGTSD